MDSKQIISAITKVKQIKRKSIKLFGDGTSAKKFYKIIKNKNIWSNNTQKYFKDYKFKILKNEKHGNIL